MYMYIYIYIYTTQYNVNDINMACVSRIMSSKSNIKKVKM